MRVALSEGEARVGGQYLRYVEGVDGWRDMGWDLAPAVPVPVDVD